MAKDVILSTFLSQALHYLLQRTPSGLWELPSLAAHLSASVPSPLNTGMDQNSATAEGDVVDIAGDAHANDDDLLDNAVPLTTALPETAIRECTQFHRAVNAVCAWTTGPRFLLRSPIGRSSIPINIAVVDLPREPITAANAEELMERWAPLAQWSTATSSIVRQKLESQDLGPPIEGACHCEAGLMASLLLHVKKPQDLFSEEPSPVSEAFEAMVGAGIDENAEFSIGAARTCCPVCRMLADVLRTVYQLDLELPGQHNRYRPWVPPHWLPTSLLETLEKQLLGVITRMVSAGQHLRPSRASSPGSDVVTDDEDDDDISADIRRKLTKARKAAGWVGT
ncbi:hypothetical protein FB451DRAFT_374913 [Mycena latifolia]|nr:hypothetical protein FB451DRAFT_374913 [Mycena latifolia]